MESAMDGHVQVARLLLEAGAKTSMPNDSFESPLTLAACGGHCELVALLLDFGADIEEPNDEGYTPLMEAAREGHRTIIELLLNRGANVNPKLDDGLETPLTLAAACGFRDVVELLVARGGILTSGNEKRTDDHHLTPLYEATNEGHNDVAQFIVEHLRKTYAQKV
jgi:ankyrin repeat protein